MVKINPFGATDCAKQNGYYKHLFLHQEIRASEVKLTSELHMGSTK